MQYSMPCVTIPESVHSVAVKQLSRVPSTLTLLRWLGAHVCAAESVAHAGRCTGCRTQVCWLCSAKLPATNPYSHFTANGCPNIGGGAAHSGGGVPAGAWARVPVSAASCPPWNRVCSQRVLLCTPVCSTKSSDECNGGTT